MQMNFDDMILPDDHIDFEKISFDKWLSRHSGYERWDGFLVKTFRIVGVQIIVCKNPHLKDYKNDHWWNQRKWCACESETTLWIVQPCDGKETKEAVANLAIKRILEFGIKDTHKAIELRKKEIKQRMKGHANENRNP